MDLVVVLCVIVFFILFINFVHKLLLKRSIERHEKFIKVIYEEKGSKVGRYFNGKTKGEFKNE